MAQQTMMKALVYGGFGTKSWMSVPMPGIYEPTDAVIRMTRTTICDADLRILNGEIPAVTTGRILGHEGIGIVEETGSSVMNFKIGDRVLISCITSCGACECCRKQLYAHCHNGGWLLGHLIDGTQAEYVRIPHADCSLHNIPSGADEEALVMLSDTVPTGFEIGILYGSVKPGDVIAIVGAGPVGIATMLTAKLLSPSKIIMIDVDDSRLALALSLGATEVINSGREKTVSVVLAGTGAGVDVAIEAVGLPETFDICQAIVRPGGHIANIGVHDTSVDLKLNELWMTNITLTTGLVNTNTTPMLINALLAGTLATERLITHRFTFNQFPDAYELFGNAQREHAMKVILCNAD